MSKAAQQKETQRWADEKPKLDLARKLRGTYYIDPDDMEFKNTKKNVLEKLEVPLEPAMFCKSFNDAEHEETRSA